MPDETHIIKSLDLCLKISLEVAPNSESPKSHWKAIEVDLSKTSVRWGDSAENRKIRKGHHRGAKDKMLLRFIWAFIAYKYAMETSSDELWYGIPQKVFGRLGENLRQLDMPDSGNKSLRELFGIWKDYDNAATQYDSFCRIVYLFFRPLKPQTLEPIKFSSDTFEPVVDETRLPPGNIHVTLRFDTRAAIRDADHEDLERILLAFDPYEAKTRSAKEIEEFRNKCPQAFNSSSREFARFSAGSPHGKNSGRSPEDRLELQQNYDDSIDDVFANVIKEIEAILNRHQLLRNFIADSTTRFIENHSGSWCVTEEVRTSGFRLEPVLNGIADRLDDFGGDSQDWKSLGEVAGGLSVLGLDRSWVAGQIVNARTASAEYLAHDESVGIGDDRYVNLLHLVTCGLADGIARLESLYHDPPLDDHRLPDDTGIEMGTWDDDKEMQLKLFLIRSVMGRRTKIDMNSVAVQLELVRDICVDAFKEDKPYYGSSSQYKDLVDVIRKKLLVEDLLLIFPSGANPKLLVADCVSVFRCLGRIFDAVQANTGMQS